MFVVYLKHEFLIDVRSRQGGGVALVLLHRHNHSKIALVDMVMCAQYKISE